MSVSWVLGSYVSNPAVETLTIDKKSIDSKQGTFTSDSETYTWSGIDEKAERYYDSVAQNVVNNTVAIVVDDAQPFAVVAGRDFGLEPGL